ncbi:MAG: hypothetical protein M3507_02945 [Actinomycetota bacterium]|nr:hypothetical protein [Actinomycetota bacterium]
MVSGTVMNTPANDTTINAGPRGGDDQRASKSATSAPPPATATMTGIEDQGGVGVGSQRFEPLDITGCPEHVGGEDGAHAVE